MQIAYRWINRDLGKLEFVFAILFISICLGTLVNKSLELFSFAERRLAEGTVSNIQTALQLQLAIQSIKIEGAIKITEGMNPMNLMQSAPEDYKQYIGSGLEYVKARQISVKPVTNYLGEMYDPDIDTLDRGNWYFDYNGNLLIYLFKHNEYFGDNVDKVTELKYTVKLDYTDIDNNNLYEAGKDVLNAVSLDRIGM